MIGKVSEPAQKFMSIIITNLQVRKVERVTLWAFSKEYTIHDISLVPRPLPPPPRGMWPGTHCLRMRVISQVFMGFVKSAGGEWPRNEANMTCASYICYTCGSPVPKSPFERGHPLGLQ